MKLDKFLSDLDLKLGTVYAEIDGKIIYNIQTLTPLGEVLYWKEIQAVSEGPISKAARINDVPLRLYVMKDLTSMKIIQEKP